MAKHPNVEHIVMCEIDEDVVNVSRKYLNNCTAVAFEDPRVELVVVLSSRVMYSSSWMLLCM